MSPEGTIENSQHLGRPFGTQSFSEVDPKVETLGYFRMSLRDKGIDRDRGSFLPFKSEWHCPGTPHPRSTTVKLVVT
jgi:hypothetical protein